MKRTHVLLYGRRAAVAAVAALLLVAGFWASWGTAQHVILSKGREHGTLKITSCGEDTCTGPYDPEGPAAPRTGMTIEKSVAAPKGSTVAVVVKPSTTEVVRTGMAGALHAWLPLGGALLLASLLIAGGLRQPKAAWATAAAGGVLLLGAFIAL
ncbi:hypothetical protein AB0M39_13400 [Streptomyces sp. NPDC051907]|uniref:hypothetical protein n=1 Tax=Streptomyces sp. NPDC051907 TaxID=3155284 RepID=UPI0034170024